MNRTNIEKLVKKPSDEDGDIALFCNEEDATNIRGYVTLGEDLFLPGFPVPTEVTYTNISELIDNDLTKYSVYDSHEGTIIRVFFIKRWYVSTNRKLDAMKSKWASKHKTFGQSFTEAIRYIMDDIEDEEMKLVEPGNFLKNLKKIGENNNAYLNSIFSSNLDPEKKYIFILKPSEEERIVCRAEPIPTVYHIGTYDKNNVLDLVTPINLNGILIDKTKKESFSCLVELKNAVHNINIDHHQGFLLICHKTGNHLKFYNPTYKYLFSVRDNVASLKFRYLQLRLYTQTTRQIYDDFLSLYTYENEAKIIEENLYKLSVNLYQKYKSVYILKEESLDNKSTLETAVLKNIHQYYLKTRNKINPSIVNNALCHEKVCFINQLLNGKK